VTEAPAGGVLVVGYGNVLRSDDGVGWTVADALAGDPRLKGADVRAVHQLAPELALDVSRSSLVILVDAALDEAPGSVAVQAVGASPEAASAWSHHLGPGELVALAGELWGPAPPVFLVSVGAASLEVGEGLSPVLEAAVPRVVDEIAAIVAGHGRA
jgi:hydrogenase maturation protease